MPAPDRSAPGDPARGAANARRRAVIIAGHEGDLAGAEAALTDASPAVRAAGLGALARMSHLADGQLVVALADGASEVRRRAAELAGASGRSELVEALLGVLNDRENTVVEMAAWALGEIGDRRAVPALAALTRDHDDPLCREAAVAALGALGDEEGLAAILDATRDRPAVRRRAVLALAPFSGPEVDAALARARHDRDWQVRQAAEDLTQPG